MLLESIAAPKRLNASVQNICLFNMPPMQSWGSVWQRTAALGGWRLPSVTLYHWLFHSALQEMAWWSWAATGWLSHLDTSISVYSSSYTMARSGWWDPGHQQLPIIRSQKVIRLCVRFFPRKGFKVIARWLTSAEAEVSKTVNVTNHPHAARNKVKKWSAGDMASGRVWLHKKMCWCLWLWMSMVIWIC